MDEIRDAMKRTGARSAEVDRCPVCGHGITSSAERVRVWPGTYAHRSCASYARRDHSRGHRHSQRVHGKFTRT